MRQRPDFFIIGAPKCGTTALAAYLAGHPRVLMSVPKEPYFFATDLPGIRWTKNLKHYESLFETTDRDIGRVGEASVWYLYSREAVANIRRYRSDARLIAMLRNPADMVNSLHGQYLYDPIENERELSKAWALSSIRKMGREIPKLCTEPKLLYYDEVACYGEQLTRVYHHFPKDQVCVILYEDFVADPAAVYTEVLNFLNLDREPDKEFPVVNPRKTVRSRRMQHFLRRSLNTLHRFRMEVQYRTGLDLSRLYIHRPVMKNLVRWNLKESARVPLAPEMRSIIQDNYRDDGMQLAALLGRDLSGWYGPV